MKKFILLLMVIVGATICVSILVQPDQTNIDVSTEEAVEPDVHSLPLGKHFMIGHAIGTPVASTTDLVRQFKPAGIIIMGDVIEPDALTEWIQEWQAAAEMPLLIAIDQEGGVVSRIKDTDYTQTSQREIASVEEAYKVGWERGQELAALGINMNFAPVLDTVESPEAFMFDRVFTPRDKAATYGAALSRGLSDANVTPVAKHFPGHDDTPADSHFELPIVPVSAAELPDFVEPFAEYIQTYDPTALMTAHVLFPEISDRPATLSKYFLIDLLRTELGFEGVVVTDDISMDAIDATYGVAEASIMALTAGSDIILLASEPNKIKATVPALELALQQDDELKKRLTESDQRLTAFLQSP